MPLEPWYRVVTPRPEVREGRSFSPDEFAIALEQSRRAPRPRITPTRRNSLPAPVSPAP